MATTRDAPHLLLELARDPQGRQPARFDERPRLGRYDVAKLSRWNT